MKKSLEKVLNKEIVLFAENDNLKVTTTLEHIIDIIKGNFNDEEIACFMFMLTADSDFKIEENYLKIFGDFYSSEFSKEEGYSEIAEGYKKLLKAYKD